MTGKESNAADTVYATNQRHYEAKYSTLDLSRLICSARDLTFFDDAIHSHTSWFTLYYDGFQGRLQNKKVLELGAGDGLNALLMARLGAKVTAVEISPSAVETLSQAAEELDLDVDARCGNFLEMDMPSFDFVVGKAFLHHLDHEMEEQVLKKISFLLGPLGEARFCEPAVNSRALDALRWLIPTPGRPSRLARAKFAEWKRNDPHPERDNSSGHYAEVAGRYFSSVRVTSVGGIERFRRLAGRHRWGRIFGRAALRFERTFIPEAIHRPFARCQLIVMTWPQQPR